MEYTNKIWFTKPYSKLHMYESNNFVSKLIVSVQEFLDKRRLHLQGVVYDTMKSVYYENVRRVFPIRWQMALFRDNTEECYQRYQNYMRSI